MRREHQDRATPPRKASDQVRIPDFMKLLLFRRTYERARAATTTWQRRLCLDLPSVHHPPQWSEALRTSSGQESFLFLGVAHEGSMTSRPDSFHRIYSLACAVWMFSTLLANDWRAWLLPVLGALLMATLPARWMRRNPSQYMRCWYGVCAFGVGLMVLPFVGGDQMTFWMGGYWFMLFLGALPPSSGKGRRKALEALKKLQRQWARGIPLPS